MKTIISIFVLAICLLACTGENSNITHTEINKTNKNVLANAEATLNIEGMTCAMGCAARIQKKLSKMDGVSSSKVDFESKTATISYDNKITSTKDFIAKVASVGGDDQYSASEINQNTEVTGNTENEGEVENINKVLTGNFELPNILDFFTNIF